MEKDNIELRMYFLTLYNISPIQQGIQAGHSVVEYGLKYFKDIEYQEWAKNHKTFIILNGGVSNHSKNRYSDMEYVGSMEQHLNIIEENNIKIGKFYEPDLNDSLTAICFIVDERVFNKIKYPDFDLLRYYTKKESNLIDITKRNPEFTAPVAFNKYLIKNDWENWISSIGGDENFFLRNFLKNFRMA